MITIDGSDGEGGGQILRTALSLSMLTGEAVRIEKIRAKRKTPGLLRRHLTSIAAARTISGAKVDGAHLGSNRLTFTPGPVRGGDYSFAVGAIGSTSLVFQALLPALLRADAESTVILTGSTHVPSAPTFDYLDRVYLPLLRRMGASVDIKLGKAGFSPAGGGRWTAKVAPALRFEPLVIDEAGAVTARRIVADVANIAYDVAEREARLAAAALSWPDETIQARTIDADCPGNVLAIHIEAERVAAIFTGFGERGLSTEAVAAAAVAEARDYLVAKAPVGRHLADQLLLPMAMAGGGSFVTPAPSAHTRSTISVIEKFLAVEFEMEHLDASRWRVSVAT